MNSSISRRDFGLKRHGFRVPPRVVVAANSQRNKGSAMTRLIAVLSLMLSLVAERPSASLPAQ